MTCAECQDLLLDLSYGELDAARAAAVEEHARTCAACASALAELSRTRALVAPLGELEDPPAGFDAKILEAARTEAVLLGGGTEGPVIAADVRVQPLAVEAAQIDARARVQASPRGGGRRRWALRAALAGSAAAAAAIALFASSGGGKKVLPRSDEAEYRIQVRTADEARRAAAAASPARAVAPPAAASRSADAAAPGVAKANTARAAAAETRAAANGRPAVSPERAEGPPAGAGRLAERPAASPERAADPGKLAPGGTAAGEAALRQTEVAPDPAALERRAGATRRQGAFGAAATLYQEASRTRAAAGDAAAASWDLAHAVECLAAAGRFAEARAGRAELRTLYPNAEGPQTAADRALRTAPADDAPSRERPGPP